LPAAELYVSESPGVNPDRPGDNGSGRETVAAPVAGTTESFSSRPRIAPPPLGSDREGRTRPRFAAASVAADAVVSGTRTLE
jgi:hypothetical protein